MNRTLARQARSRFGLAAVGLVTVLAVGACGGSGGGYTSDSGSEKNAPAPAQGFAEQDSSGGAKTGTAVKFPVRAAEERSIIYKGELTVRASNVDEAAAKASTIATGAGGVVAGDNRRDDNDDEQSTADLTIRVPSAAFYGTVGKLSDLGKELSRGIDTEDVTEQAVDLDTRIASQTASVDRTRALLSRAQQITDIVTIEQELARREADLGSPAGPQAQPGRPGHALHDHRAPDRSGRLRAGRRGGEADLLHRPDQRLGRLHRHGQRPADRPRRGAAVPHRVRHPGRAGDLGAAPPQAASGRTAAGPARPACPRRGPPRRADRRARTSRSGRHLLGYDREDVAQSG